ncbi:MAG TPA: hypothetical protein VFD58_16700 [Blastocatellia bacterium]|nr:hypothetical protein [Blastocatellia bacterium]
MEELKSSSTFRISFEDLAVIEAGEDRLPLSALGNDSHIHGGLRIRIGDRLVPSLGHFGPDDVCFSDWIYELQNILKAFEGNEIASYTFDEGEQGQPAFLFERQGDSVFLSIIDSASSGGKADPEWQKVPFAYAGLVRQVDSFITGFVSVLRGASPERADEWIAEFL